MRCIKITFQFHSKSTALNIYESLSIAEKCNGIIENNFYKIDFTSPKDENVEKLYNLVGRLKGSKISINGRKPIPAKKFFKVINCQDLLLCNDICNHFRFGYYSIDKFSSIWNHLNNSIDETNLHRFEKRKVN